MFVDDIKVWLAFTRERGQTLLEHAKEAGCSRFERRRGFSQTVVDLARGVGFERDVPLIVNTIP